MHQTQISLPCHSDPPPTPPSPPRPQPLPPVRPPEEPPPKKNEYIPIQAPACMGSHNFPCPPSRRKMAKVTTIKGLPTLRFLPSPTRPCVLPAIYHDTRLSFHAHELEI
ncbi:hypothetical protein OG21DRAFT_964996 [Imleria badia]|nr:hypothetical protein OG21DRAFT_964996 [Imleria badia]